ncbi:HNH endonuclease [bacterium]|nr:MAG: HNH endonuclease [bacterium]
MKKLSLLFSVLFFLSLPFGLNAKGRSSGVKRSPAARSQFMKANPCPSTGKIKSSCLGFVVGHIVPLKRGGTVTPANLQ